MDCPESLDEWEELARKLPLCRRTTYDQAVARIKSGAAKSRSDAARQIAQETGKPVETVQTVIKREQQYRRSLSGSLNQLSAAERASKENTRQKRRDENKEKICGASITETMDSIIANSIRFPTIVVDPPWDWGDEGDQDQLGRARPTYQTMPVEDISALRIAEVADQDCHLYLWITNRSLPKGFALIETWGFRYITCLTWCKPSIGMGNYFRGQTEHVLFGVKGSQPLLRKNVGTWFEGARGKAHSGKPDELYDIVERCSPGPRVDIFARKQRRGWTSIGAEA